MSFLPRIAARLRAACDDRGPHARPRQAISANIDCPSSRCGPAAPCRRTSFVSVSGQERRRTHAGLRKRRHPERSRPSPRPSPGPSQEWSSVGAPFRRLEPSRRWFDRCTRSPDPKQPIRSSATRSIDNSLGGLFLHWQHAPSGRTIGFDIGRRHHPALFPPVSPVSSWRPEPSHLWPPKPPTCHSATVFPLFLWRWIAITGRAGRDIDHALCPLVQVARTFGRLGHLMMRHFATYLSSISFASLLASRRVA